MKRVIMFFSVCFILMFSGCGGPLYHPTKGPADFEREKRLCESYAIANERNVGYMGNPFVIRDGMRE